MTLLPEPISNDVEPRTELEYLQAIYASQMRVESAVMSFLKTTGPVLESVKKKGLMGLIGAM